MARVLLCAAVLLIPFFTIAGPASRASALSANPATILAADPPSTPAACDSAGLGWLICPLTSFFLNGTDVLANTVILPLLKITPLSLDDSNPVFKLWQGVRNIANILFIIVFFFIIFSQATSIGISTYGIKRMLPKLVFIVILVNLSYYGVAFLIDAFNIFGAGVATLIYNVLGASGATTGTDQGDPGSAGGSGDATFGLGALLAGLGVAGAATSFGWIWGLILTIGLVILAVILTLAIRQVLVILLVILSPLMAIGLLLPNTERLANRGWSLLWKLLFMYPLIVFLLASGRIAQAVIAATPTNGPGEEAISNVTALLVAAIPLALIPGTFFAASSWLGKIHGAVNSTGRQWTSGGARGDTWRYGRSGLHKYRKDLAQQREQQIRAGNYTGWRPFSRARSKLNREGLTIPAVGVGRFKTKARQVGGNQSETLNALTGGYGAQLALADRQQRSADRAETSKLFGGDYDLEEAWLMTNGDRTSTATNAEGKGYYAELNDAQKAIFNQLAARGYNTKSAEATIAALQHVAESGRANEQMIRRAVAQIQRLNPGSAVTDLGALNNALGSTLRGSGRGDLGGIGINPKDGAVDPKANWSRTQFENLTRHVFDWKLVGKTGRSRQTYIDPVTNQPVNNQAITAAERTLRDYLRGSSSTANPNEFGAGAQENVRRALESMSRIKDTEAAKQLSLTLFDLVRGQNRGVFGGNAGEVYANNAGDMSNVLNQLRDDLKLQLRSAPLVQVGAGQGRQPQINIIAPSSAGWPNPGQLGPLPTPGQPYPSQPAQGSPLTAAGASPQQAQPGIIVPPVVRRNPPRSAPAPPPDDEP